MKKPIDGVHRELCKAEFKVSHIKSTLSSVVENKIAEEDEDLKRVKVLDELASKLKNTTVKHKKDEIIFND